MPTVNTLPQVWLDEISEAVSSVFNKAIAVLDEGHCPVNAQASATSIAESILRCAQEALSVRLGQQNGLFSAQRLLPDELWCSVWEYLPFFDCVAVSHVSSRWRRASLACPSLWTNVTCYTTVHAEGCQCYSCDPDYDICCRRQDVHDYVSEDGNIPCDDNLPYGRHRLPVGWKSSPYHEDATNTSSLNAIFARSAELPLAILVHIVPYESSRDSLRLLAQALATQKSRIEDLQVLSADSGGPKFLYNQLGEMAALRSISVKGLPNGGRAGPRYGEFWCRDFAFERQLEFPRLQRVELGRGFAWPFDYDEPLASVIRDLTLTPVDPEELVAALSACPGLQTLSLDCTDFDRERSFKDLYDTSVCRIGPLDSLRIVKPPSWVFAGVVDLADIKKLSLCEHRHDLTDRDPAGLATFSALSTLKELCFTCDRFLLVIQGADTSGRYRRLDLQIVHRFTCVAARLISCGDVDSRGAATLSLDWALWPLFAASVPFSPNLTCLEIVLGRPVPEWNIIYSPDPDALHVRNADVHFPFLRTLRLARSPEAVPLPV